MQPMHPGYPPDCLRLDTEHGICVHTRSFAANRLLLRIVLAALCLVATLFPLSGLAQGGGKRLRPRVVLVLCEGLTFDDLRSLACPQLAALAEKGALGLM